MNHYIENVSAFMNEIDWKHAVNDNGLMVHFGFQAQGRNTRGLFVYHPEQEELICKVLIPQCSPECSKRDVAELMTRYNGMLFAGQFSMDWESGLILFSVYHLTNGSAWMNRSQIRCMLHITISETLRCLSLFDRVIQEQHRPEDVMMEWILQQEIQEAQNIHGQETTENKLREERAKYEENLRTLLAKINKN